MRHCLACGGGMLITYLDLGAQPLANTYHDGTSNLPAYPLGLNVCEDCYHSQLTHAVDPDLLFRDYAYVSGTTATLSAYFDWFVDLVGGDGLNVLDVAGNDGTLLTKFAAKGHTVLNVDPAENLQPTSEANGVPTLCAYWSSDLAKDLACDFDIIVAMNVLGHVSNPLDFLVGCRDALAEHGRIYIQTSQCEMVERGEFDTVYHEHHSFFTAKSFLRLADRAGLVVESVTKVPVHGTSYLWTLSVDGTPTATVADLFDYELTHGYYTDQTYADFGLEAKKTATWLSDVVDIYRENGYLVVGYGAAAKGNTLLNFAAIHLDCIVDDNPLKVGSYTPGVSSLIVGPEALSTMPRDLCIVVLSWNFWEEITERVRAVRDGPDVFARTFPTKTVELR